MVGAQRCNDEVECSNLAGGAFLQQGHRSLGIRRHAPARLHARARSLTHARTHTHTRSHTPIGTHTHTHSPTHSPTHSLSFPSETAQPRESVANPSQDSRALTETLAQRQRPRLDQHAPSVSELGSTCRRGRGMQSPRPRSPPRSHAQALPPTPPHTTAPLSRLQHTPQSHRSNRGPRARVLFLLVSFGWGGEMEEGEGTEQVEGSGRVRVAHTRDPSRQAPPRLQLPPRAAVSRRPEALQARAQDVACRHRETTQMKKKKRRKSGGEGDGELEGGERPGQEGGPAPQPT
eukprot:148920-Rhodomonas_salina.3